jgi:outer membrane biosynthesis protein TonB
VRYVRVTIVSTLLPASKYMDLSEFGVYTDVPVATPTPTATPTATATPIPTATAPPGPQPTPSALPAPAATPTPKAAPTPTVTRPTFTLSASGKRAIRVKARCPRACAVSATLTVDAATARKLALGKSRSAGSLKRTLKAGTTTITIKLASRVKMTKVTRFKATLMVRSGSVVERRRVTISR